MSLRGLRPDGKWGAVHSTVLFENAVAASSLYKELLMAEVSEALGLASEPRAVSAGRRPVMERGGVPHELIGWMAKRGRDIDLCRQEPEHEYVTAVDEDGNLKFAPVISEQARTKLNRIAARKTLPSKPKARSLAQLRADWKASDARAFLGGRRPPRRHAAGAGPGRGRREQVAAVVAHHEHHRGDTEGRHGDVQGLGGPGAEARRILARVQRGRRREPAWTTRS